MQIQIFNANTPLQFTRKNHVRKTISGPNDVVDVHHLTIVPIGTGLMEKFWDMVNW